MALPVENPCSHKRLVFPQSNGRESLFAVMNQYGTEIENSLTCPKCSPRTSADVQEYFKKTMKKLLTEEANFYMVTARHELSAPASKTDLFSRKQIKSNPSLKKLGDGGYYNYPDPVGSAIRPYSIGDGELKILEKLVFSHPMQAHAPIKEGCDGKAQHACCLLRDTGLEDDAFKVFYSPAGGEMYAKTVHGEISWRHHVVAAVKDHAGTIHVFDTAFNQTESLVLEEWYRLLGGKDEKISLLSADDLSKTTRDENKDYLIRLSFNEDFIWENDQATVFSCDFEYTNKITIAPLRRSDLRKTLKAYPILSLIADPFITFLKSGFSSKTTLKSEIELNHICSLKKLYESLDSGLLFMTLADIQNIEPYLIKSDQESEDISMKLFKAIDLAENAPYDDETFKSAVKMAIYEKIDALGSLLLVDPLEKEREYKIKVSASYKTWIDSLSSKKGVVTIADGSLLKNSQAMFDELTSNLTTD